MRALRWHGRRDVRLEEVPDAPRPGPGEVRVAVAWCGICGSDVHEYLHGPFVIPLEPHPVTGRAAPVVLGHEIAGWVDAVGPGADSHAGGPLRPGDLVVLNALLPDGTCDQCRAGAVQRCRRLGHLGMSADGGLADLVTVPSAMAVRVPPGVPPDAAALAEPFAVAARALRAAGADVHRPSAVLGAGAIGLAVGLMLRRAGVEVTVHDVHQERLDHARRLGLDARSVDDPAAERAVAYDCTGAPAGPQLAVDLLAPGGLAVLAGLPQQASTLDVARFVLSEIRAVGAVGHVVEPDLVAAVRFLAAEPGAAGLVTDRVELDRAVTDGLDALAGPHRARHGKILVRLGG